MKLAAVLALLAGCGRVGFGARVLESDGGDVDAAPDAETFGAWNAPVPLLELNTTSDESDPDLRADGLEIVFHSLRTGGLGGYDLYLSRRSSPQAVFAPPSPITALNTTGEDTTPAFSGDGLTLYFSNGNDIVFATRPDLVSPFGARQALPELSSTDVDTAPEISGDGRIAVVTRGTVSTRELWMYTRAADGPPSIGWGPAVQLTELGSPVTDSSPDLDLHGLTIYFHSDRAGSTDDIYVATRPSTAVPFEAPQIVADGISTGQDEGDPTLTADQRVLVFHRQLELMMSTR